MLFLLDIQRILRYFKSMSQTKNQRTLPWNPQADPEVEDRAAFLRLSSLERWEHIVAVILATYPGGAQAVSFEKRKIEWM